MSVRGAALYENADSWPHWNTPEAELRYVRRLGPIGLDPCSNAMSLVGARISWCGHAANDNGLFLPWAQVLRPGELVFCNPPYADVEIWMEKCAREARAGAPIVCLVAARTETDWCHAHVFGAAQGVCFPKGRIPFRHPDPEKQSAPRFPSLYGFWGREAQAFQHVFGPRGRTFLLPNLPGPRLEVRRAA